MTIIIAIVTTALAMATITTTIRSQPVLAATKSSSTGQQTFSAIMKSNEEIPPKNTQATGSAKFISMTYRIRVANINGVTMAHIHSGKTQDLLEYMALEDLMAILILEALESNSIFTV